MPVRNFSAASVDRCHQAEAALDLAISGAGTWVDGDAISAQWPRAHGTAVPAEVCGRWQRAFEPALAAGRVIERRRRGHVFYAPAAQVTLPTPELVSDLERIEYAVQSAVARVGGAIPVELVEAEIASNATLTLQSPTSVAVRLGSLARTNRLIAIRPAQVARGVRGRVYYTTPAGPRTLAREHEMAIDRRTRAINALWRAVERRPFTTHALAAYAASREHFRIADDSPYGWTNAMQHLEGTGFLVRADAGAGDPYFVRWALRADWEAMSDAERAAALRDTYGRDDHGSVTRAVSLEGDPQTLAGAAPSPLGTATPAALPVGVTAGRVDVGRISRSRDMAVLIVAAAAAKGALETDPDRRRVVSARPVTVADVSLVSERYNHLLPRGVALATALSDAARVRDEMREASIARIGRVGNVAYYALESDTIAREYVQYVMRRSQVDLAPIARAAGLLRDAIDLSVTGIIPVASNILRARWAQLTAELTRLRGQFEATLPGVERLAEEVTADTQLLAEVAMAAENLALLGRLIPNSSFDAESAPEHLSTAANGHAAAAQVGVGITEETSGEHDARHAGQQHEPSQPWQLSAVVLLDVGEAAAQLEGLTAYRMQTPRELWARIYQTVRVIRPDAYAADGISSAVAEIAAEADSFPRTSNDEDRDAWEIADDAAPRSGRRVGTYLDRVGFGAYMTLRWGGPMLTTFVSRGLHALGELRSAAPLRDALNSAENPRAEGATVAALALLDDPTARATLAEYVRDVCAGARHASVVALSDACRGLGPRALGGLAKTLSLAEREALERALDHDDDVTRTMAASALRAWDESWDRDALLNP